MNIALIGTGTIGSGVVEILNNNSELIKKRTGVDITLKKVCELDFVKAKKLGIDESLLTNDYKEILSDKSIDIVIELIGGYEPARTIILEALNAKKHIVTANKAVIAKHGKEIFETAEKNNVKINFEAAVGGCIPIIKTIRESYSTDRITAIYGILNGTTNYIISRMEEGMDYKDALKKAQELGFAEADPTFDVEGLDAAQKIVILSRLAYNSLIDVDIPVTGITKLKMYDLQYAKELGYKVKLLAISKLDDKNLDLRVQPVMIPLKHGLSAVNEEINAAYITSEQTKETMLYGRGAGKLPTATVVVSDIVDIAKKKHDGSEFFNNVKLKNQDDIVSRFYLRLMLVDKPGVLAQFTKVLGENNISINAVSQKEEEKDVVPVIVITHKARYGDLKNAMKEIKELDVVKEDPFHLMIEDF